MDRETPQQHAAEYRRLMQGVAIELRKLGHTVDLGTDDAPDLCVDGVGIPSHFGRVTQLCGLIRCREQQLKLYHMGDIRGRTFKTAESRGWRFDDRKLVEHLRRLASS